MKTKILFFLLGLALTAAAAVLYVRRKLGASAKAGVVPAAPLPLKEAISKAVSSVLPALPKSITPAAAAVGAPVPVAPVVPVTVPDPNATGGGTVTGGGLAKVFSAPPPDDSVLTVLKTGAVAYSGKSASN
jgi:hypothetical protein